MVKSAAAAVLVERQQKMYGMHQVRALPQQAAALQQRLADQPELGVFQVAQPAVDDARRAAGSAGGKVVLLDQQGATPGTGALPGNSHAVNSAANDDDLEPLAFKRLPDWGSVVHIRNQNRSHFVG